MTEQIKKIDPILEKYVSTNNGEKVVNNFEKFSILIVRELVETNNFTEEKIEQCTIESARGFKRKYIQFTTEKELRENPYFKLFYENMGDKYQRLIDAYIKTFEYCGIINFGFNRGYRSKIKLLCVNELINFYVNSRLEWDFFKVEIKFKKINFTDFSGIYAAEFMINPNAVEYFKRMVYDNENITNISDSIIKGAIKSNNPEVINTVFDLLKASRLSEGLRSTIIKNIDCGSIETYKMFLDYIRSENLMRFASVKNTMVLYIGPTMYDKKSQEKCVEYIFDCVLDDKTNEYLEDENPLKVYVALYSLSLVEESNPYNYILTNYKGARSYRRGIFIYFLWISNFAIPSDIITHYLDSEDNPEIIKSMMCTTGSISFDNDNKKRKYVSSYLDAIKKIKASTVYSYFNDTFKQIDDLYFDNMNILQYVYELNDNELYEKAYSLFNKFSVYPAIINKNNPKYTFLNEIYHPAQRKALIDNIGKQNNYEILSKLVLDFTEDEYFELGKKLKTKNSNLRNNICSLFTKADTDIIIKVSKYLISQKKDEQKNGGLSILVDNIDKIYTLKGFKEVQEIVKKTEFSHEIIHLKHIVLGKNEVDVIEGEKNEFRVPTLTWDSNLIEKITNYDFTTMKQLANKWWGMFKAHTGEEVEITKYDGIKEIRVIGVDIFTVCQQYYGFAENEKKYKKYHFYEEFLTEFDGMEDEDVALLYFMSKIVSDYISAYKNQQSSYSNNQQKAVLECLNFYSNHNVLPELKEICNFFYDDIDQGEMVKFENWKNVLALLKWYYQEEHNKNLAEGDNYSRILLNYFAFNIEFYKKNIEVLPQCFNGYKETNLKTPYWNDDYVLEKLNYFDDKYAYNILLNLFNLHGEKYSPVGEVVYFYFIEKGIMPRKEFMNKLLSSEFKDEYKRVISSIGNNLAYAKSPRTHSSILKYLELMKDVYIEVTHEMFEVELNRSDSETKYSKILSEQITFYGIDFFVKSLDKMKNIDFVRNYAYLRLGIKEVFSIIIEKSIPEEDLTQKKFNSLVKKYKISDKKLIEASLYNKNFTGYIANYLKIKGLEKAMYYFNAHSLDHVSEEAKFDKIRKNIKRYSNFELEDFVDGKMDIMWFKDIQSEMNRDDYKKVYDASKFIMDTSKRKRSQYFSDAVLGNLKLTDVEAKINDKRNQDMLLCFGLIPLGSGLKKEKEAIRRYKRIQKFLKESKQFGAQRRATEARKVQIAISNLATNYGLDITRFTWIMEANIIEEIKDVFEPKLIGEIEVYLSLENIQNPEIIISKSGKKLKSVPAKYKKDEHIIKVKEAKKDIKDQFKRYKIAFEEAMINSDNFSLTELNLINSHPVVKEVIKNILFISSGFIGFLDGDNLIDFSGKTKKITKKSKVRIAHCTDLVENNWIEWQNHIMKKGIIQPFKQVFRELYTLTDEELANDGYTNRFAGYQIDVKKVFGVLSSRNWMVNDDIGLEKVNHAQNLRIDLYCYADWRNANVLEAKTLEQVMFINNKTNKSMNMKKLDKVLFSETMRDMDLAVSVAYVGGVDPLLNHTTLEMRKRILNYNLNLFKITNYEIKEKHIHIDGTLGKYYLHLGSGVVSVEGKGMLPMTPVNLQWRGHIFLPFVDEDPKTSEIITKVLMLAEDNKLNDPTILQFLK